MTGDWRGIVKRYGTALAALALFAGFAATADNFLALGNLLGIAKQISIIAILAAGFALALTAAELDLSFANVASLAAVAAGLLVQQGHAPALALAVAAGPAAVLLGMTMFEPGHPNIPGTLMGALTIGMLSSGLVLLGAPYYVVAA
jgi:ribose transport system permease protein